MKRRIRKELLDELLAGYEKPEDLTGPEGLLKQLTGALVERALSAELTDHLGHEPGAPSTSGNARNGTSPKTLTTDQGDVPIEVPRDRNGTFEPQLVKNHQRRFTGFDDKILSMYARGMSVRDIQAHLSEIYGTEISPTLISTVTDAVPIPPFIPRSMPKILPMAAPVPAPTFPSAGALADATSHAR